MKFWKNWPYWLKGGMIGGGVTFVYALLFYLCPFITSGYSIIGCGALFYMSSPIYPVGWAIAFFQPIFHYGWIFPEFYGPMIAIILWFIIGAASGTLIGYIKSKRKNSKFQNLS